MLLLINVKICTTNPKTCEVARKRREPGLRGIWWRLSRGISTTCTLDPRT
jgi:hypothetical protein